MKITQMDKAQLVQYMKELGQIGLPDGRYRYDATHHTWKRAFELARQNGYESVEMDCSKCVATVAEWLLR